MAWARFLVHTLLTAAATYFFAAWAKAQSDRQIAKMQDAVFNTPGAEAPVPPAVAAAGFALIGSLWLAGRRLLRLRVWQALIGLLAGAVGGAAAFVARTLQAPQ
jgi:hypothetical protein